MYFPALKKNISKVLPVRSYPP